MKINNNDFEEILFQWNNTDKNYPLNKPIQELFEGQVAQTPDSIALVFKECSLTYDQLNSEANKLARHIKREYEVYCGDTFKPNTLVPICLDRSLEMVISMLAILKAGGAYVPMDPNFPPERFNHILIDTSAKILISQKKHKDVVGQSASMKMIFIDKIADSYPFSREDSSNLELQSKATDLAYVIYTSGTTGLPKGVMIEHAGLVNRFMHMIDFSGISSNDVYLFKTNYLFDASVADIFCHLLIGAKLVITSEHFNINEIELLLHKHNCTNMHCVPSQFVVIEDIVKKKRIKKTPYNRGENYKRYHKEAT